MHEGEQFRILREIYDQNGADKLALRLVRVPDTEDAWNFDALLWETESGTEWNHVVVLSCEEVAKTSARRRWVADIASFDAQRHRAIIMVGEESEPDSEGRVQAKYSWWDCDVASKRLVRRIREDVLPEDKFDAET